MSITRRFFSCLTTPLVTAALTLLVSSRSEAQTYGVAQELFNGLSTTDLTYDAGASFVARVPDVTKIIAGFTTTTLGNGFGQRLRAFVIPPLTGPYIFAIASDDWSDLYLSTDETPGNRVRIANVNGATGPKVFDVEPNQISTPVLLSGGRRYYIEVIHRDGGGADNVDVRWQLPDDSIELPLTSKPGSGKAERLIAFRTNTIIAPVILKQPTNASVLAGRPASFSLLATNLSPLTYQWRENGVDIPGETRSLLVLDRVLAASNGKSYDCVVLNEAGSTPSSVATLTLTADTVAPFVTGVAAIGTSGILVTFSEAVIAPSATIAENYKIAGVVVTGAALAANPTQVILQTGPLTLGQTYSLTVAGVQDLSGLPIVSGSSFSFFAAARYTSSVGATNSLGTVTPAGNGYDFTAGGREIGARSDQFVYQWSLARGNFDVQVRVEALGASDVFAKAGLMARDDLGSSNRFAAVFATPSLSGVLFQSRSVAAKDAATSGNYPINYPSTWVRLQREGSAFRGYASSDAQNWTLMGTATIAMPEFVYLGLAATSRNTNGVTTVAKFRDYADATGQPIGHPSRPDREPPGPSSRRGGLSISEIMYHPREDKPLEFVEIFNAQPYFEDISGYSLTGDIQFTFPNNTLIPAGGFLVVAKSPEQVQLAYGITGVFGPYSNNIPNSLGTIRLMNENGGIFQEVSYEGNAPWPVAADGSGHSLVLARPSYGEGNVKAWSASDVMGGSPGSFDGVGPEPLRGVVINEFLANPGVGQTEFLELYNHNPQPVDVSGAWLSDSPLTNKFRIPEGTILPAHGFVSFSGIEFGFGLSSLGETVYLVNPSRTRVIDVVRYPGAALGVSQGRFPDGADSLQELKSSTPAAANAGPLIRDVVINEIMYAPITGDNDDEFIELYNKGAASVSLAGWKLANAVTFTFPSTAVIPAKGYVVIGRNLARLLANYPNLNTQNTFGNYGGSLANSGDRIQLLMAESIRRTNTLGVVSTNLASVLVEEVAYQKGGRWGQWSDGGGSSLELIDPNSDHRRPSNWADSDESKKAPWTTVEYTGRVDLGAMETPAQLHVFLQNPGEALLDDVEVFTAGSTNVLLNSSFEKGFTGWVPQGTHQDSNLETSEGYNSKQSLHVRASARGDTGGNRVRSSWATALPINKIATIRAKVRWLAGTPHILLRLRGNYLECPGVMTLPKNLGTPGALNSRAVSNAGPAIFEVSHQPVLPTANQPIVVTAHVSDPDGLGSFVLRWRNDAVTGGASSEVVLNDDGTGDDAIPQDGIYTATLPGQPAGAMIAFYLSAKDGAVPAASSTYPNDAPVRECLVRVGEQQILGNFGNYRIWMTAANVARWNTRGKQSNHPLDCTFAYNDFRSIYNSEALYSGSPWHTPGYTGPMGAFCDYVLHTPPDDLVLGATDFVLATIGNQDNDPTKLAEQSSYWIARKLGLPYNYRRFMVMWFNGLKRASALYEDTQQPNGDLVNEYYSNDSVGRLHKIEDWFEFNDGGDDKSGNVDATLENFTSIDGKKAARYRVCWRPRSVGSGENPNDFSDLFKAVDALNSTVTDVYNQAVPEIINVEQWMRVGALEHIVGNWDSYGYRRGKNMFAYKPSRGRFELLMWDIDFDLGSGGDGTGQDIFDITEPVLARLYGNPVFRRTYLRIMQEAVDGPLRAENFGPTIDAKSKALLDNGAQPSSVSGIKQFVAARRDFLISVIPKTNFVVYGPSVIQTNVNSITLTGAAPVSVEFITVNGIRYPLTWTTSAKPIFWSLRLPLAAGVNDLTVQAFDKNGHAIVGATKQLQVVFNGQVQDPVSALVFSEISYSPVDPDAGYIEIYNRSTTTTFELTGWRLSGVGFDFPSGISIAPGQYRVVAKDIFGFGTKFGFSVPVIGQFIGNLDPQGETITLLRPSSDPSGYSIVDRVRYDAAAPWVSTPVTDGAALQLLDASQDNSRVSNWSDDGDGWRFVSLTGNAGGSNLFVYLTAPGDVYIDNLSLVAGNQPGVGQNLIANGDFELPLAGTFRVPTNHVATTLSTDVVYAGKFSLHLIGNGVGATTLNASLAQTNVPVTANGSYTLSYWMRYGQDQDQNLIVRLNPGNLLSSTQSVARVLGTPGRANIQSVSVHPYPDLWLNEVGPYNDQGPKDGRAEHEPWVELYNSGTAALSLQGYYLSDSYTNLTSWAFPADAQILPGEFKVIWLDADAEDSIASELHASFRLQPTLGSVAFCRVVDGKPEVIDYLNYAGIRPDETYGSVPDGQPFNRQVMSFATPHAANNGASRPLDVRINEWMASNTGFILDHSVEPPAADDWFELYNPGRNDADLGGYYLTDNSTNKTQFKIPSGTLIPAGGYLLVWADGTPLQNSTNSPDLHVNFQLSKSGEEIGLFAADGTAIDAVSFKSQTNNISQGRLPDGGSSIVFFDQPTPRSANKLSGNNTPPTLAKIGNRVVDERTRLVVPLSATDAEEGSDQLIYSLASGAPVGATLTPHGLFVWRPSEAQGPGSFPVTFLVNDNGTPSLQASETITIVVREVNQPPIFLDPRPRYVKAGELLTFATAVDKDLPAQSVGFHFGSLAPAGATIDPTTGIFSWTPTPAQAPGRYAVLIEATDNGAPNLTASFTYDLQVFAADATVIALTASLEFQLVVIRWASVTGDRFQVESAASLGDAWTPFGDVLVATGTSMTVQRAPTAPSQFYRVRKL